MDPLSAFIVEHFNVNQILERYSARSVDHDDTSDNNANDEGSCSASSSSNELDNIDGETKKHEGVYICRVCLCKNQVLYPIGGDNQKTFKCVLGRTEEEILAARGTISRRVCKDCETKMTACSRFRKMAQQSNMRLISLTSPNDSRVSERIADIRRREGRPLRSPNNLLFHVDAPIQPEENEEEQDD